jgi:D-lactate dehydrogenase
MKAVFFEIAPWERRCLKRALAHYRLAAQFVAAPVGEHMLRAASSAEIVSVFIYSTLTSSFLGRMRKLKFVATRSTGFDHIDLAA